MRIALVSTSSLPVPPRAYGGTELVVHELAKMLSRFGHEVVVYATGDSKVYGELRYRFEQPVWPPDFHAELRHATFAWADIQSEAEPFDVVHVHSLEAVALAETPSVPCIATLHHARDEAMTGCYVDFSRTRYVAISNRQAALHPELPFSAVIHHGVDSDLYPEGPGAGGYCAFVARFAPEKAPHLAIDAARAANMKLCLGGAPHWVAREYFEQEVMPRIEAAGAEVEWLGEVTLGRKIRLLSGAAAFLAPICWEEPFGLAMIEAMLIGTPVIAFARGSAPEIVEEGLTGHLVKDVDEMAERLRNIHTFDRRACRARARQRWTSLRMAREYEALYLETIREQGRGVDSTSYSTTRRVSSVFRRTIEVRRTEPDVFSPFWRST